MEEKGWKIQFLVRVEKWEEINASYPVVIINNFFQNTGFSTTSGAADYNFLGLAHTKAGNHHYIANLFLAIGSLSRSESGNLS